MKKKNCPWGSSKFFGSARWNMEIYMLWLKNFLTTTHKMSAICTRLKRRASKTFYRGSNSLKTSLLFSRCKNTSQGHLFWSYKNRQFIRLLGLFKNIVRKSQVINKTRQRPRASHCPLTQLLLLQPKHYKKHHIQVLSVGSAVKTKQYTVTISKFCILLWCYYI
jgi:hypothetical protein